MSMMEALAITKPVMTIGDSTEDERTSNVQPQHVRPPYALDQPPMYEISTWFFYGTLLFTTFYFILVGSFFVNGLDEFSFDPKWFYDQNAPRFPFSSRFYSYPMAVLGSFLIFPAMFVVGTATFSFPFCGLVLMWLLVVRWRTLLWSARLWWVLLIAATVGGSLIAESSLGFSILLWIGD